MTSTPSSNFNCAVTNNITLPIAGAASAQTGWNGSLIAISGMNAGSGTAQGFAQTSLTLMDFASGETLASNSASAIALSLPSYNLIFAQTNNLFPALTTSAFSLFGNPYNPCTITSSDSSSCANALLFYQNINAFPSSTLAKNFAAALNSTNQSATSSSSIDQAINSFFASTDQYQNVTFNSYGVVTSYLQTFAFAWANFSSSYTYYLYQSSGTSPSGGTVPSANLLGTITFCQNPDGGVPSLTDTNGGYSITYTQSSSQSTTPLYFSSGQLVSSTTEDTPLIALQFTYLELSQVTGNANDAGTIVPVIAGILNGVQAFGTNTEQSSASGGQGQLTVAQQIQNVFNAQGMADIMQAINLMFGLQMVYEGCKWLKETLQGNEEANHGAEPTESQLSEAHSEQASAESTALQEQQATADRLAQGLTVDPTNLASDQENFATQQVTSDVEEQVLDTEDGLDSQASLLETEAQLGINQQMEDVAEDANSGMSELKSVDPSNTAVANSTLESVDTELQADDTTLDAVAQQELGQMTMQQDAQTKQDETADKQAQEEEEEDEREEESIESGDDDRSEGGDGDPVDPIER